MSCKCVYELLRVLHIEDDQNIAFLFGKVLQAEGFDYVPTDNGMWALELIENDHFDVIIVDLSMPEISGFDFIREFREKFPQAKQRIIVMSSLDLSLERELILKKFGVDTFVQKPISLSNIVDVLKQERLESAAPI